MKISLIEQVVRNQISVVQPPSPQCPRHSVYCGNFLLYTSLGSIMHFVEQCLIGEVNDEVLGCAVKCAYCLPNVQ